MAPTISEQLDQRECLLAHTARAKIRDDEHGQIAIAIDGVGLELGP